VFSLEDGTLERAMALHDRRLEELALGPAGTLAAAVSDRQGGTVVLFDPRTGEVARRITLPDGSEPASVAFDPGGRWLAVGCWDGLVRVYDPKDGTPAREFAAFPTISDNINDFRLVAGPSGQLLCQLVAAGDEDAADPRVFDPGTGRPLEVPYPLAGVRQAAFDPTGALVATRTGGGSIVVYDAPSGAVRRELAVEPLATEMAFFPDGRRLVVSGEDRLVRVWDVPSGESIATYAGHTGYIYRLFVRPSGGEVVSVASDGTARVWVARAAGPPPWAGHTDSVSDLAVSPDGRRVLTASYDGTARVWDAARGACLRTLRGHNGSVYAAAISPDGRRAATGGEDGAVRFWGLDSGDCERVVGYGVAIDDLAFASAGRILILDSVTSEGPFAPASLYDVATGELVRRLGHPEVAGQESYSIAASPTSRSIAVGFENGDVVVWPLEGAGTPVVLRGHGAFIDGLAFFPDGRRLASASADRTCRVWDTATGRAELVLRGHTDTITALAISVDGRRLATSSYDKNIVIWDSTSGADLLRLDSRSRSFHWSTGLAFGADGTLYAHGPGHAIATWSAPPAPERVFTGHARRVTGLAYLSPDVMVSGDWDGIVRVWETTTGRERRQLVGHSGAVNAVAAFPDGRRVATAGDDRTIRIWDAATGRSLRHLPAPATPATRLAVSPDGRRVAAVVPGREAGASPSRCQILIADADTGTPVLSLPTAGGRVWALAYRPDGRRLATACEDGTIRLWDPADGRLMAEWAGHRGRVLALAISPDGRLVASGGDDRLATLWEANTGRPIRRLPGHLHRIAAVSFRPDGRSWATAGYDGVVREWDTGSGEEIARHATARGSLDCLVYSPDGRDLVFGGSDTAVRVSPTVASSATPVLTRILPPSSASGSP
jgi:WD40 repeat protein